MSNKIGILLPRSDMFPTLALDFINGFKLGISVRGSKPEIPEIVIEGTGNASDDLVIRAAEKMILQENVDLTIAFCGIFSLKELVKTFTAYGKNLIHIDLGGNVITRAHVSSYVIHQTLNLWQSAYRSGEFAAMRLGKNAAIAVSYYDGGYHLLESFVRGFSSMGGNIVYSYVAPFDYQSESFDELISGIENSQADFVYSLFSFKEEQKLMNILSERLPDKSLPFVWSPLIDLRDEISSGYRLENLLSVSSWNFDSEKQEMSDFMDAYHQKFKKQPNIISLLGFETALTYTHSLDEEENLPPEIGTLSQEISYQSPRGEISFNSYHEIQNPMHFVRRYNFTQQPYKIAAIETIKTNGAEKLYDHFRNLPDSGWKNPYIIT